MARMGTNGQIAVTLLAIRQQIVEGGFLLQIG
jgi:hypothetical protein